MNFVFKLRASENVKIVVGVTILIQKRLQSCKIHFQPLNYLLIHKFNKKSRQKLFRHPKINPKSLLLSFQSTYTCCLTSRIFTR